ncbi:MAG: RHS repeat-associated core domain-containing protein [Chitinophagaceae bacterium]|nr:RHS repeat-associated core domain-containing protein [Chitinophagaceae bacterium]
MQQQVASTWSTSTAPLALANIRVPRNGYVYAYVSNRSDQHVYFDDFKVSATAGNIIEENHYYAFGMKIAAISSKKLGNVNEGVLQNNYQYQGTFSEMDEDIGLNDFPLRNYDPQTGRWIQQDPYQQFASPYVGMGNDPVNLIDPSGGVVLPYTTFVRVAEGIGKAAGTSGSIFSGISTFNIVATITSITLSTANTVVDILNSSFTQQMGPSPVKVGTMSYYIERANDFVKEILGKVHRHIT